MQIYQIRSWLRISPKTSPIAKSNFLHKSTIFASFIFIFLTLKWHINYLLCKNIININKLTYFLLQKISMKIKIVKKMCWLITCCLRLLCDIHPCLRMNRHGLFELTSLALLLKPSNLNTQNFDRWTWSAWWP